MSAIRQDPTTRGWHLQILPRRGTIAGFEPGSGIVVTTLAPEESAAALRALVERGMNVDGPA